FPAVHAIGHDEIGQKQVDVLQVLTPALECVAATGGFANIVAKVLEHAAGNFAHRFIVLDEQNRLVAPARRNLFALFLSGTQGLRGWKKDFEGGAFSRAGLNINPAVVLLNDAISRGQTEASAFARSFGGKEGLEDMRQMLGSDARARV